MSLINKLNEKVERGEFNKEDVKTLVNKALELSGKSNENDLTTQDLLTAAKTVGSSVFDLKGPKEIPFSLYGYVGSYSSIESMLPAQQEVSAQEPAPEAPQADAPPEEIPAQQEVSAPATKSEPVKKKESTKKAPIKKTNYHYSFSGADCDVYAYRSPNEFTHLKTIATLSTSIYESKSPVRVLGSAGPVGYTGSIRTIAGSMVFVLTEDHPLRELLEPKSTISNNTFRKFDDTNESSNIMLSGMAAPFNILVIYKNEVGAQLMYRLEEVEIISEGIVSSVNDMITEMVFQFVALDMKQISKE